MDYEQAVKEKMQRQKEETLVPNFPFPEPHLIINDYEDHPFQQSYIEQESFEPRKFLFYKYNKKVRTLKEPTGLCYVCRKLEVEHNA